MKHYLDVKMIMEIDFDLYGLVNFLNNALENAEGGYEVWYNEKEKEIKEFKNYEIEMIPGTSDTLLRLKKKDKNER